MGKNYVIYGDTPFAEEICNIISHEGRDSVLAFTNDRTFMTRQLIIGKAVIPFDELNETIKMPFEILLAYGYTQMNKLRAKVFGECKSAGMKVGTYISTNALCYSDRVGEGSMIWPNVYIGPRVSIGRCNIIQASCTLAHDNAIGDFNYLAPGVVLGGRSTVNNYCFIGLNSTIKSEVCLEDYVLIGCGSNVLHNCDAERCYIGNPAKLSLGHSIGRII